VHHLHVLLLLEGVLMRYTLLLLLQCARLLLFCPCQHGLRSRHVFVGIGVWLLPSCYLLPVVLKPHMQYMQQDLSLPICWQRSQGVDQFLHRPLLHPSTPFPLLLQCLLLQLCVYHYAQLLAGRCTS
jgi:hypothetical protein